MTHKPLSVLTGASSGIGLERARLCAKGRILVTGSIAGLMPGRCQAVCNVTKPISTVSALRCVTR
ncbi:hypothetical protein [Salipiger marinus]|uniref:Short chain dehydrogenase n=1 Tax=Salipiger marinus TaxID=555512 RepID=A0A1G8KQS8_9RHOB|nr:hypothetical protein [Salipiger marinus]SDI45768.1 hypothetical protein SAMN04487993_100522 [Salipiger marinus]